MKILCIGDSNTYGFDPRSYLGSRYPADVRWTDRLAGHEVINCGVNGMTVPRDSTRHVAMIRANAPDLVTVMLGTNDLFSGADAETIAERMRRFLDQLCATGTKVLLIAPPPPECSELVMDDDILYEGQELGRLYRELAAEKGCLFADAADWGVELSYDGVHFSPDGHAAFARGLAGLIEE